MTQQPAFVAELLDRLSAVHGPLDADQPERAVAYAREIGRVFTGQSTSEIHAAIEKVVTTFVPAKGERWPAPGRFARALQPWSPSKRAVGSTVDDQWIDRVNAAERRAVAWVQEQIAMTDIGRTAIRRGTARSLYHVAKQVAKRAELAGQTCQRSLADIESANRWLKASPPGSVRSDALVAVGPRWAHVVDELLPTSADGRAA